MKYEHGWLVRGLRTVFHPDEGLVITAILLVGAGFILAIALNTT